MLVDQEKIVALFGSDALRGHIVGPKIDLTRLSEVGFPKPALEVFTQKLIRLGSGFMDEAEIRECVALELSDADVDYVGKATSERAVRIAEILILSNEVIGNDTGIAEFLFTPHVVLEGIKPIDAVRLKNGYLRILSLLKNAANGLPV